MKNKLLALAVAAFLPALAYAQSLPSEQFVLYKVWSSDSTALKNLGYGDYIFSARDTVVLEGSDTDTVRFSIPNSRGFFTIWISPDTANFPVESEEHQHQIGETDSLTVSCRPGNDSMGETGNPATALQFLLNLDWDAEKAYYESLAPPVSDYLDLYISHTGAGDTSAVIIEIKRQ